MIKHLPTNPFAWVAAVAIHVIALLLLSASIAHACSNGSCDVPVKPSPEVSSNTGASDWLIPLAIIAIIVAANAGSQPPTANCDTISNQTIYGADGKPLITNPVGRCD